MSDCADKFLTKAAQRLGAALLLPAVLLVPVSAAADVAPAVRDIRILVDVSGSMRQTDPDQLRFPALRLLTGLIPGDARAGVWTFGRYVNMLVPYGAVDDAWRDAASAAIREIPSAALFTNIEGVLETSTWNWQTPADGFQRHLILFTDGMVDLPGGAIENAQSRTRITDSIVQRLKHAGVRLHVIALSDATDDPLLRQLAALTGGRFEKTNQPAELEQIVLRIFEQVIAPESRPLRDQDSEISDRRMPPAPANVDDSVSASVLPNIEIPLASLTAISESTTQDMPLATDRPNRTMIGLLVLVINLLLLAATWYAWRRWVAPPPETVRTAVVVTTADSPALPAAADETPDRIEDTVSVDQAEAPAATVAAGPTLPASVPPSVPAPAPTPGDEAIVLQGINVDDIELDFDDAALKRGAG